jgi:hypothetical protein
MRGCATPKQLLGGADADAGEFGLCENKNGPLNASKYVVVFISDCVQVGGIFRDGNLWRYERLGIHDPPGPIGPIIENRTVAQAGTVDCAFYNIEWTNNTIANQLEITVDGNTNTGAYTDWTQVAGGTAYIVAQNDSLFTKQ